MIRPRMASTGTAAEPETTHSSLSHDARTHSRTHSLTHALSLPAGNLFGNAVHSDKILSMESQHSIIQIVLVPLIEKRAVDKIVENIIKVSQEIVASEIAFSQQQQQQQQSPAITTLIDYQQPSQGALVLIKLFSAMEQRLFANSELQRHFMNATINLYERERCWAPNWTNWSRSCLVLEYLAKLYQQLDQSMALCQSRSPRTTRCLPMFEFGLCLVGVVELFQGLQQTNATVFDSLTAHSGLFNHQKIFFHKESMRWLLPMTAELSEEMMIHYIPELPFATEDLINYNQTRIRTAPLRLCLLTELPSSTPRDTKRHFDILKDDFDLLFLLDLSTLFFNGSIVKANIRHHKVFYNIRHQIAPHILSTLHRLFSLQLNFETRRLMLEVCEVVIKWEQYRQTAVEDNNSNKSAAPVNTTTMKGDDSGGVAAGNLFWSPVHQLNNSNNRLRAT
uniref:Uncharacterized protein n=1 Tax=Globodera rostochiensis TaxID=31243 RepID=A0A914IBD0_GLORO